MSDGQDSNAGASAPNNSTNDHKQKSQVADTPVGQQSQKGSKPSEQSAPAGAAAANGASKSAKKDKAKAPTTETGATSAEATGEKKLTGAELKAKAKAEKAARRANQKVSKDTAKGEAAVSSAPGQLGPSALEVKKQKGKQDGAPTSGAAGTAAESTSRPAAARAPPSAIVTEQKSAIPEFFSHLSMAKRLPSTLADKDVHPAVLALGQRMATFAIDESIARLEATLQAFKQVIASYKTPPASSLSRHFTPHVLNPQIEYLTECRPMCFSMGNAIRWLKLQVSKFDPDAAEEDAKHDLCKSIDNFIAERITVADTYIMETGATHIQDGDRILTYGRKTLIERTLLHAKASGVNFSVCVIDDPFEKAGQILAKNLLAKGIDVEYCGNLGGLRKFMLGASKVLLASEAVFNNGALYAPAGTCEVARAAKIARKKVLVLSETINITERVATDSLTYNEIDPERCSAASFRLLFDTTPDDCLTLLITDLGSVRPKSAPDLLRKLEEFN